MSKTLEAPRPGPPTSFESSTAEYEGSIAMLNRFKSEPLAAVTYAAYSDQLQGTLPSLHRFLRRNGSLPFGNGIEERPDMIHQTKITLPYDKADGKKRFFEADIVKGEHIQAYVLKSYYYANGERVIDSTAVLTIDPADGDLLSFGARENNNDGSFSEYMPTYDIWDAEQLRNFDNVYKDLLSDLLDKPVKPTTEKDLIEHEFYPWETDE